MPPLVRYDLGKPSPIAGRFLNPDPMKERKRPDRHGGPEKADIPVTFHFGPPNRPPQFHPRAYEPSQNEPRSREPQDIERKLSQAVRLGTGRQSIRKSPTEKPCSVQRSSARSEKSGNRSTARPSQSALRRYKVNRAYRSILYLITRNTKRLPKLFPGVFPFPDRLLGEPDHPLGLGHLSAPDAVFQAPGRSLPLQPR